jgi:hypothetical protein
MSSSLLYCLGRVRRVKAKSQAVAARALTRRLLLEGWQPSRRAGEDHDAVTSVGRTTVRRAIGGPLTSVTSGLLRSFADTPPRRSGHVTSSDCTDSQADNAGSIPVTTPREKPRSVRQSEPGPRRSTPFPAPVQIGRQLVCWGQARRLGRRCHRRPGRNRAGRASRPHP